VATPAGSSSSRTSTCRAPTRSSAIAGQQRNLDYLRASVYRPRDRRPVSGRGPRPGACRCASSTTRIPRCTCRP
jgi:hypothetical protein